MHLSRNNPGTAESSYQWSPRAEPSRVHWTADYLPDPPKGFPDVPLNVDHRYCTPPPMDPRFMDPPIGPKDDFPVHVGRAPSPGDFDELTGARPPIAHPGSRHNPFVVEDDTSRARQHRASRQGPLGPPPGLENHTPRSRQSARTASSSRQPATSSKSHPSASSSASASSPSSASRTARRSTRAAPSSPAAAPRSSRGRNAKATANNFTPKTSSPLKQVAFRAHHSESPAVDTASQPDHLTMQDRWHIPPRKHSAGSVTMLSVSSSDSESD
ncbi:hypothetical protein BC628DRAFT_40489 [Trametes gibbosa]|nr:hypothetical protein BC628DRAFT_40489 [Trametes gibbosa]